MVLGHDGVAYFICDHDESAVILLDLIDEGFQLILCGVFNFILRFARDFFILGGDLKHYVGGHYCNAVEQIAFALPYLVSDALVRFNGRPFRRTLCAMHCYAVAHFVVLDDGCGDICYGIEVFEKALRITALAAACAAGYEYDF